MEVMCRVACGRVSAVVGWVVGLLCVVGMVGGCAAARVHPTFVNRSERSLVVLYVPEAEPAGVSVAFSKERYSKVLQRGEVWKPSAADAVANPDIQLGAMVVASRVVGSGAVGSGAVGSGAVGSGDVRMVWAEQPRNGRGLGWDGGSELVFGVDGAWVGGEREGKFVRYEALELGNSYGEAILKGF